MILLALLLALVPQASGRSSPLESGLVRSVEIDAPAGTYVAYFRLDAGASGAPPAGLLRYLAGPDPEGGQRIEMEFLFLSEGLRLVHGERVRGDERRTVFREFGARSGRTLILTGSSGTGFEATELGGPEVLRRSLAPGGEFPLALLEGVRQGKAAPGTAAVFEPLSTSFEPLSLATRGGFEERILEARRDDESLRWSATFRGEALIALGWSEGGPRARAIPREEYERLRGEHELARKVAEEAAARKSGFRAPR